MHPEEIKAAMRIAGITPAMLASELGVANSTISVVIHGRGQSARIKTRISKVIGKPVATIWPDDGRPKLQRPKGSVPARKPVKARA